MSVELKPCPWCATIPTPADAIADTNQGGKWGSIVCPGCGIVGPDVRTGYGQPVEWARLAIEAWNTRALEQREAVDLDWPAFIQPEDMPLAMKAAQITGPVAGQWVRLEDAIEHAENVRAASTTPPRDVPDAPFVERVMVRVFDGDKELTEQVFGAKFGEAVAGSKGREVPPCMVRLGTVYISPRDFVHISSTSAQLREARKAGAGAAVFVIAAAPSGEGSHG